MAKVRKMKVAGQFYEKDSVRLELFLEQALDKAEESRLPENSLVRSVIAPHAGYIFSGKTAVKTINTAAEADYENIFIISPSHYVGFRGLALSSFDEYETPLGNVEVNSSIAHSIKGDHIQFYDEPHINEHSLEVQLPIIKKIFPETPVVPMVCGQIDFDISKALAQNLSGFWNKKNLWLISSDFTHYGRNFGYMPFSDNVKENLKKLDLEAIEKILDLDPEAFYNYIRKTDATICGRHPILIMLNMCMGDPQREKLKTKLIEYITSGDLTDDFSHTVSYAGITVFDCI